MAQALQDIYNSLNSTYNPQRDLINSQIQQLPGQYQAQQQGLDAQKNIAFQGVDNQANSRGMLYSGVPTQEDNNYIAANYLPAVANLKNQQNQQQYGLQSALNQVGQQQQQSAQSMYNTGLQNDMQQKYYDQQIALAQQQANMYANMYGRGGGGGGSASAAPAYNYAPAASPQVGYSAPQAAPAASHPNLVQSASKLAGRGIYDLFHPSA